MNEIKKLQQEINEIKNETKRKLNMLDVEINNLLRKLYLDLAILRLKCEFFENSDDTIPLKRKRI